MQTLVVNILLVLLFVVVGGLFAASEIALVSLRPGQIKALTETHPKRGAAIAYLVADQNNFLSSVQVGVTLAGFFSASFGAAQISPYVVPLFVKLGMAHALAATLAFIAVTVLISYLSLVLGELVPKRLAMQSAQVVALLLAPPLMFISRALRPVIWFLGLSTNTVLRLLGRDPEAKSEEMAPDELRDLLEGSAHIGEVERRMAVEALGVEARRLSEIMTPRTEVEFLDAATLIPDAVRHVAGQEHSRYPVFQDSYDDILGYIHVRDLLAPRPAARTVRDIVRPMTVFPESKRLIEALPLLRNRSENIALVVDEYGGTDGVVTIEDIVEEFVGEITDEFDHEDDSTTVVGGTTRVPGLWGRNDVRRAFGVELPEGAFDTLAGYMLATLGRVAVVGDCVQLGGLELTVAGMDGRRIEKIDVLRLRPVDAH